MNNINIRKFDSIAQYQKYRNTDGWIYPAINIISNDIETQTHYNNELRMRWSTTDSNMVPIFLGDVSLADFKTWVDNASYPCEIKKDGSDFAYIKRSTGSNIADWTLRSDGSASHYNTSDKADYLQMTEIENINVGLFENTVEHWQEVRFNFDRGCPKGFHKWFAHPYWNESRGKYTKLIGRYNTTPAGTSTSDTTAGINCAFGLSQGGTVYNNCTLGNWSADRLLAATKATNPNLLEETYWEHVVLSYIFSAYYETFNHQSIFYGHATDCITAENPISPTGAGGSTGMNGHTDGLLTPHGTTVSNPSTTNGGYRFMHIENAIHGQQWIWGAGWSGDDGKYYMTYDDIKANASSILTESDADVVGTYPTTLSGQYFGNADLWCIPTNTSGGSSSTRYCDAAWSATGSNRVAYLGGTSSDGSAAGSFSRAFSEAVYSYWNRRGRSTMNRGTVSEISDGQVTPLVLDESGSVSVDDNTVITVYAPEEASGTVTLYVDNEILSQSKQINGGQARFTISFSTGGNHPIHVHYGGDENYRPANVYGTITVNKLETVLVITVSPIEYGETATVTIGTADDVTGNIELYIGNQTQPYQTTQQEEGVATFEVNNLPLGDPLVRVHYVGDGKYLPTDSYSTIEVGDGRMNPELSITADGEYYYGDGIVVTIGTADDVTGNMELYIDNQTQPYQTTQPRDGKAVFYVTTTLPVGNHSFHVHYVGDGQYRPADSYDTITVNKLETDLWIETSDIAYGDNAAITVATPTNLTGNIELYIDNQTQPYQTTQQEDGVAVFEVENLSVGSHSIHVHYVGDEHYLPADAYDTITVKIQIELGINASNIKYGKNETVTTSPLPSDLTGNFELYIEGVLLQTTTEIINGKVRFVISKPDVGRYAVHVHYGGNEKYLPADAYNDFQVKSASS